MTTNATKKNPKKKNPTNDLRQEKEMLTARVRKEAEVLTYDDPRKGQVDEFWVEFETLNELEHFIAYNRAYIREITFTGTLKTGEEE